ncbi:preprotein translocase subunit SecE [Ruminococcus sp. AM42-11]|uniref:preprotein translocase subunit SecE n=1 Tax=Ruminococcus sp. AM42-11 TaxID=2292372 RepID=UPI00325ADB2A
MRLGYARKRKICRQDRQAKEPKKSWFQGLKAEFNKIVWTDRDTLMKQSVVVIVITVILGAIISVMDAGILECINLLIK